MLDLGKGNKNKLNLNSTLSQKQTNDEKEQTPPVSLSSLKLNANNETENKLKFKVSGDLFSSPTDEDDPKEEDAIVKDNEHLNISKTYLLYTLIGTFVIIIVLFILIIALVSKRKVNVQEPKQQTQEFSSTKPLLESSSSETIQPETKKDIVGIQDFTQNTNMKSSSELSDTDLILEDLYGLSLRVDYTVSKIDMITDFVNYEKRRGTWGGGLELYWLDAKYKDTKYIIQIPFKYYKELDDSGIVPVKMEVLRIKNSNDSDDDNRNVISYMTLDEVTLKELLKKKV